MSTITRHLNRRHPVLELLQSLWVSFIVGAVLMVVVAAVQLAATGHMMKRMYKGAMRGYVAGAYEGETKGAQDAKDLVSLGLL